MKGISAIVATYRRNEELRRLFDSLLLRPIESFELIIVDQNKDGLIDDLIYEYSAKLPIKHFKLTEANQSKARNYGAQKAKYPIICFPDDDCWFEQDSIFRAQEHFEWNENTDLLIINWKQNPYKHDQSFTITKKEIYTFRAVGYVTYVLFFRKEVFMRLGGFIENIGIGQYIGGGEDSELTFRAAQKGLKIYYDAAIMVNHNYISVNTRNYDVIRARQRGMGMVYAKYDIPYSVIVRGIVAPFVKMFISFNGKKSKEFYNIFRGRVEGFVHTLRYKRRKDHFITGIQ